MRLENPYVLVNGSLVSDPLNLSIVKPLDKVQIRRGRIVEKTGTKNLKLTRAIRTWRYEMSKFRMVTAKCPIDKVPLVIAAIEHLGVNVIGSKK
ncbi:hypothetical protein [Ectothiorhodospira shaposhnikovii]|uniref:hypothetical protein n=1 Tax=Ectothiorhodospira shaposhnikovii TaxID=1054 RepID=UPI001EE8E7CA|nr:hypothetical protein [Ectothiorhodospira shaposhnikovii]MCG5512835.1 hypothetical protein [Ectothiorhodospira shaposhnikovii]